MALKRALIHVITVTVLLLLKEKGETQASDKPSKRLLEAASLAR
jgi:hypothetical protein